MSIKHVYLKEKLKINVEGECSLKSYPTYHIDRGNHSEVCCSLRVFKHLLTRVHKRTHAHVGACTCAHIDPAIPIILQLNFSFINIFRTFFYVSTYYTGTQKCVFIHPYRWTFRVRVCVYTLYSKQCCSELLCINICMPFHEI